MRDAGKRCGARGAKGTAKQVSQASGGIDRNGRDSARLLHGHQRALRPVERIGLYINICQQHGVDAARLKQRGVCGRHKADEDPRRGVGRGNARVSIGAPVGILARRTGGDSLLHHHAHAVQRRRGNGLRHIQQAGRVHEGVRRGVCHRGLHGGVHVAGIRAVSECGQGAGGRRHRLEGGDGTTLPQVVHHVGANRGHASKGVARIQLGTGRIDPALVALQRAQGRLRRHAAVLANLLIEHAGGGSVRTRYGRVQPVGQFGRRPPQGTGSLLVLNGLHALHHIG